MEFTVMVTNDPKERGKGFAIRRKVFVEEQQVPLELELDDYDECVDTLHVLLLNQQGDAVGTARFRPYGGGIVKIERVAVLADYRKSGAGRVIMETIEGDAKKAGYQRMKLGAQLHAKPFYERLGFQSYGSMYMDAGIEHIDMLKDLL